MTRIFDFCQAYYDAPLYFCDNFDCKVSLDTKSSFDFENPFALDLDPELDLA